MTQFQQVSLFLLRVCLGWYFFWAGITKVLDPNWSAAGFLNHASMFPDFYAWFARPEILPVINFLNAWGLTLIGISLLVGVFVRLSAFWGVMLMVLYYFAHTNEFSFITDDHMIIGLALFVLASFHAGRMWGLENWCAELPICARYPRVRNWLG